MPFTSEEAAARRIQRRWRERPPHSNTVKVFSDIHGNWDAYSIIIEDIEKTNSRCVCLGDLIDRGIHSCEIVIDYARRMRRERERYPHQPDRWKWFFVLGNHELMLLLWLQTGNVTYWNDWLTNGGATIFFELFQYRQKLLDEGCSLDSANEKLTKRIKIFLESFIYLMNNAYSKCYVRTEWLYVCSHAGPTDKHLVHKGEPVIDPATGEPKEAEGIPAEEDYGRNARRVWSRPIPIEYGSRKLCYEEKCRSIEKRISLDYKSLKKCNLIKHYVFGHTPQLLWQIAAKWGSTSCPFLPIDSGILYIIQGREECGTAVIGTIEHGRHYIVGRNNIPGATHFQYGDPLFMKYYHGRIKPQWEETVSTIAPLAKSIQNPLLRSFAISWVDGWADNLKYTGVKRSERHDYYSDMTECLLPSPIITSSDGWGRGGGYGGDILAETDRGGGCGGGGGGSGGSGK